MTRRASVLDAIEPIATVSLHPDDMNRLGLEPGGAVTVESRRGRVTASARRDPAIPHNAVFMPFAFVEAAANLLTNPALDPFGKIPEFKYCAVRVSKAVVETTEPGYGIAATVATS
jgi:formate dehydrogenase major subunit